MHRDSDKSLYVKSYGRFIRLQDSYSVKDISQIVCIGIELEMYRMVLYETMRRINSAFRIQTSIAGKSG